MNLPTTMPSVEIETKEYEITTTQNSIQREDISKMCRNRAAESYLNDLSNKVGIKISITK